MQDLGSNKYLQSIGLDLGLDRFINTPGHVSPSSLRPVADSVKALLAAVYLDATIENVKDVMLAMGLVPRARPMAGVERPDVIVLD